MTGAGEVERLTATLPATRFLSFPDGIHRLIRLKNSYWIIFDQLTAAQGYEPLYLQKMALDTARHLHVNAAKYEEVFSYEDAVQVGLECALKVRASQAFGYIGAAANDDD